MVNLNVPSQRVMQSGARPLSVPIGRRFGADKLSVCHSTERETAALSTKSASVTTSERSKGGMQAARPKLAGYHPAEHLPSPLYRRRRAAIVSSVVWDPLSFYKNYTTIPL